MITRKFLFSFALLIALCNHALGQTIGISLPLSGDFAELGKSFRKGVELAAKDLPANIKLQFVDDACDEASAQSAAEALTQANVDIITGFLCNDAAIVAASIASSAQIPVLVSGARSVRLIKDRERESWNLWRLAPGDDYPVATAAKTIAGMWRNVPFALVDDGTIYGRNFTDQLRFQLEELGLKPQFSDSFRVAQSTQAGLLRRLQRSGVTAVLIASATLEDLQTIAIDNARLKTGLNLITTEALAVLPFLETAEEVPAGIQMISWPLETVDEALAKEVEEQKLLPNRLIYDGYATLQIAVAAVGQTKEETTRNLETKTFQTLLGPIAFNLDGASTFNPYRLMTWNGKDFVSQPTVSETE